MNQLQASPRPVILVAPLDWGLGHATRCIPIIHALISKGNKVIIAAEGKIKSLLVQEFPELDYLHLSGYNIKYSKYPYLLPFVILIQVPKILKAIIKEHKWLIKTGKELKINYIISDNRYGLYHDTIPSVFITHQLKIKTSYTLTDRLLQVLNYKFIDRFFQCWVPDWSEQDKNLAGELSHPLKLPRTKIFYTGPLSRFHFRPGQRSQEKILILLSGPEPQRTILENIILPQLKYIDISTLIVRGLPGNEQTRELFPLVKMTDHLGSEELEKEFTEASLVIGRCGYSTIMDLMEMKKRSVLIPTPGQTEQEYLASHLMIDKRVLCVSQNNFNLSNAIEAAKNFDYCFIEKKTDQIELVLNGLIK